jgi:fatty acid desaturase
MAAMGGQVKSGQTLAANRADIAELHVFEHWPAWRLWPLMFLAVALGSAAAELPDHWWPLLLVIWPALGTVIFLFVIAFHDASHERLHPVHPLNEFFGHMAGTLMFIPFEVYRYAHARHHAYLGTERDPELWPFTMPGTPRVFRVLVATLEIVLGILYTPLLFLRAVVVGGVTRQERRRIVIGYALCVVVWATVLVLVYDFHLWKVLVTAAIVPMTIAGVLQTLNKYAQHLGLHGSTVLGMTRTVVDEHPAGEVVSNTMFYNDYHGTHHRYAKIPYYNLPSATPYTLANAQEFCPVYPNLFSTFVAMFSCLADPKVGPQWLGSDDGSV